MERVLAIVAVVIAAVALVVAFARRPGSSRTSAPSTSTTTVAPVRGRAFGTFGVDRKNCVASFWIAGDTHIPIDHVGRYKWTGPYVTLPRAVLQSDGAPEHFIASGPHVEGGTADVGNVMERPVSQGKKSAWRVTFVVGSYSGKPNLHVPGAVALTRGGCSTTTT